MPIFQPFVLQFDEGGFNDVYFNYRVSTPTCWALLGGVSPERLPLLKINQIWQFSHRAASVIEVIKTWLSSWLSVGLPSTRAKLIPCCLGEKHLLCSHCFMLISAEPSCKQAVIKSFCLSVTCFEIEQFLQAGINKQLTKLHPMDSEQIIRVSWKGWW